MSNKKFNNLQDIKNELLTFNFTSYLEGFIKTNIKYLRKFGKDENIVFEWANDYNINFCNSIIKKLTHECKIKEFIDDDDIILPMIIVSSYSYDVSKELCAKIIDIICASRLSKVANYYDFVGIDNSATVWDLFVTIRKHEKDPHCLHSFQGSFLNDSHFIVPQKMYLVYENRYPYHTKKRFSGFLAYLFYSGFYDLYEKMFDILEDTIIAHFEDTFPLPYFLYTFVKENDDSKKERVLNLIQKLKKDHPDFNWNIKFKDLYPYKNGDEMLNANYSVDDILK